MTRDSLDRELNRALNESTEVASPAFTASVLTRLEERGRRAPLLRRPVLAVAAALVLFVLGATIGLRIRDQQRSRASAEERQELIREVMALQQELDEVRALADRSTPVLYLGGDESLELMYDLSDYDDLIGAEYRPASLPPNRG